MSSETAQFQKRYQRDDSVSGTDEPGGPHVIRDEMRSYNGLITFLFDPNPTGDGRFEVTFEMDLKKIKDSPGTVAWHPWPKGDNSDHQEDVIIGSLTGWRLFAKSGGVKGQVRGSF